jgi:hypothetical protein
VIDRRDTLTPRRTDRPRHRAAQPPGVLTAAIREVGYSWPAGEKSTARVNAGAVASGLAAASIGVLVTVLIASGGQPAPARHLVAKAPSVAPSSAAIVPHPMPRHVVPTLAATHKRHKPAHRASAPPAEPAMDQPAGTVPPSPSSGDSGISYWQQLAQRFGMTTWPPDRGPSGMHRWP